MLTDADVCDVLWSGVPLVSYAGERMLADADVC
jgi:hypothetical protein